MDGNSTSTSFIETYASNSQQLCFGIISVIAVPEWIVFAVMYSSTFINVIRKPERSIYDVEQSKKVNSGSSRLLAVVLLLLIITIRALYAMYFFLAIPDTDIPPLIKFIQRVFLYAVAAWWMLILCGPAFCGFISWAIYGVGNKRQTSKTFIKAFPKAVCILPVYNEEPDLLVAGLNSILDSNYPKELIEIHVSFDDDKLTDLYKRVLKEYSPESVPEQVGTTIQVPVNGSKVYIHRWEHGGKRHAQMKTWNYMKQKCVLPDDTIIILTDSDNYMFDNAINNLAVKLHDNPKKIAYAGYMSCMSKPEKWYNFNFVRCMQDTEYVASEINRFFELAMGTVNCLPGGFTAIRYTAFAQVAEKYFDHLDTTTITDYHKHSLGEDRYLTHLVHKEFPAYSIGFDPTSRCKTDPPDTFVKFVKQRRRWLLGSIANEAYMICNPSLWKKFPILLTYKVIQTAWRSTTFCQLLIAVSAVMEMLKSSPNDAKLFFACVGTPLVLAYVCASIAGIALGRYKIPFIWTFMLIAQNIFQVVIDCYSVVTWRKRTWGGARMVAQV